jgi:hypothetical protein
VIASLHMRELEPSKALRTLVKGRLAGTPGLLAGDVVLVTRLGPELLPRPHLNRVAAFAFWSDEDALERFQETGMGGVLAEGWQMRMRPARLVGSWRGLGSLAGQELPMETDEPTAALTLGRLRPSQLVRFLKASAGAERDAVESAAMLASCGLGRPPELVSTFSVWKDVAAMRDYITGTWVDGHRLAVHSHGAKPFHRESAFVRLRPLSVSGETPWWPGLDGRALTGRPLDVASAA